MKYGYVRVRNQNDEDAIKMHRMYLQSRGAEKIYVETDGSQLQILLDTLEHNDELYVFSVDRLSRNTKDLLKIFHRLSEKEVTLYNGPERFDTNDPFGVHLFCLELEASKRKWRKQ